ncbi:coiled-coil domain-containing protein 170 [Schistocerca nitens]|uniref:coiled-coil domain-containing protein 170 n=1 Tax=Schistocerca nitens TaxID=7011 RepID=UPI00211782DC|nr:coiled-coil domain-containing protein 170 [Schistocerca nitens]
MERPGNAPEDWEIFEILCRDLETSGGDEMAHDMATSLRSELAALQYKRDRLQLELGDARAQLRSREQRLSELQSEAEQLREQNARQTSIITSLRKRVQELEDRERSLIATQGRTDASLQALQRENRYSEDKVKELEKKVRMLELECHSEETMKESHRKAMQDLLRRLSAALGIDYSDTAPSSPDSLVHKAAELVQETTRLRAKSTDATENLASASTELRSCRDALERTMVDRDSLQRQAASQLLEIDRLRQEKDNLELQQRALEREVADLRDKFSATSRSLGSVTNSLTTQEGLVIQLKEEVKLKEEKHQRVHNELRHLLESLAIQLSSPTRFVESAEGSIKERIREILQDNKDKSAELEELRDKVASLTQQLNRQIEQNEQANARIRLLQDEKAVVESRLNKTESDLSMAEVTKDGLRRDKNTFMSFLERLARVLSVDEISKDVGVDLITDSLLARAEQLARLENEKIIDKYWWLYGTYPRLRRECSFPDLPLRETSAVYQLQRRVRTLREQLQRRDLHLDLLRRKIALQEDNSRMRTLLENERDEANLRVKKLLKQIDKLQLQLAESRAQVRDLKTQLADAADYKIAALERGRKIEDLQKRLVESEMQRTRYNRKVTLLKDQVRATSQSAEQERSLNDHQVQLLRDELSSTKQSLLDCQRRESSLQGFRSSVSKLLGLDLPVPDYEIISRLQKLVSAHRDFTLVSRRYDDPLLLGSASRTPLPVGNSPNPGPRTPRFDDSGFGDPPDLSTLDDSDDVNGIYNKRPLRTST